MGALQTIESIKASGAESDFFARWAGYQAKVVNAEQRFELTTLLLSSVPPFLMAVNSTVILGLGGLRVMDGQTDHRHVIAFQAVLRLVPGAHQPAGEPGRHAAGGEGGHGPPRRRARGRGWIPGWRTGRRPSPRRRVRRQLRQQADGRLDIGT